MRDRTRERLSARKRWRRSTEAGRAPKKGDERMPSCRVIAAARRNVEPMAVRLKLIVLTLLTLLSAASAHAAPAASTPTTLPAEWTPVARAQFGEIEMLHVRDGYVVWGERTLDPRTRGHRAQSFWSRIY